MMRSWVGLGPQIGLGLVGLWPQAPSLIGPHYAPRVRENSSTNLEGLQRKELDR